MQFTSEVAQAQVLQKECIQFDNKPLLLSKWTEDFVPHQTPLVSVWIRFPKLPMKFWSGEVLSKLASQISTPIEMDQMTKLKDQSNFARVKVRLAVGISLQEKVLYVDDSDKLIEQLVEYEWRLVLCAKCNMFGHEDTNCRTKKEVKQQWVPKRQAETEQVEPEQG